MTMEKNDNVIGPSAFVAALAKKRERVVQVDPELRAAYNAYQQEVDEQFMAAIAANDLTEEGIMALRTRSEHCFRELERVLAELVGWHGSIADMPMDDRHKIAHELRADLWFIHCAIEQVLVSKLDTLPPESA
jgi:hypothetical protein